MKVQKIPKQIHYRSVVEAPFNNTNITPTGTVDDLYYIGQGTGIDGRLGNVIRPKTIYFEGVVYPASDAVCNVRVMLVRARAAKLTATDMPAVTDSPDLTKMRILYDKIFRLAPAGGGAGTTWKSIKLKKRLRFKEPLRYLNNTATPVEAGYTLYMVSDYSGFGTYPKCQGNCTYTWYNAE